MNSINIRSIVGENDENTDWKKFEIISSPSILWITNKQRNYIIPHTKKLNATDGNDFPIWNENANNFFQINAPA